MKKTSKWLKKEEILNEMRKLHRIDLLLMQTMYDIFQENKVAVVESVNGEFLTYTVREFIARKSFETERKEKASRPEKNLNYYLKYGNRPGAFLPFEYG